MKTLVSRFVKDESGATAIEYGLIAAGISVAIIAVVNGLGTKLNGSFSSLTASWNKRRPMLGRDGAPVATGAFSHYGGAAARRSRIASRSAVEALGRRRRCEGRVGRHGH